MILPTNINPFEQHAGSSRLVKPANLLALMVTVIAFAAIAAKLKLLGIGVLLALFFAAIYLYLLFTNPILGLYSAVVLCFVLIGMGRYVKDVPLGLGMDAILIMTYIALFIKRFKERIDWSPANKDITYLSAIWFAYSLFELLNPEASSFDAWFSGRGIGLYMFLLAPLTLIFIDSSKKLDTFLYLWGILSIIATLKGILQMKFGVDFAEKAWLDEGNYKTHILFGKLRVFSFLSDAGQFGGTQGYAGVVGIIYSMAQKNRLKKIFFLMMGIMGIYGMIISGTRGAMAVPLAGFMAFLVLGKNIKILSIGIILLTVVFIFFKFTMVGQGNDQIRRMRTAFDPNDASLQVRLNNQKLLKDYLVSRPFGGGIGHGGVKAQRFLPNAFLSQIATDSWYVLIWVEQGVVGLVLHLFILFYVLVKSCFRIMFRIRDPMLRLKMAALASGMFGIMTASYGNAVLGQMPTNVLLYISMALLLNTEKFDTPKEAVIENKPVKSKMKTKV